MHIQVKTTLTKTSFTDDEDEGPNEGSASYPTGSLSELLGVLAEKRSDADPGFSLAAASGHDIELGGEFSFWVHAREGFSEDHEAATVAAQQRLKDAQYDARIYHVWARYLNDVVGTLKEFVDEVNGHGLHVVEISIGAAEAEGIPVQIFAVQAS
jgi:hypothetical protein